MESIYSLTLFHELDKYSCRTVYVSTYSVLLIVVGIVEMWWFLAPRFLGLLLPFAKVFVDVLGNSGILGS